jgi:outer membrane biosynthesis protein TonB
MRIYRANKFTGAIKQVFGKPKELSGKVLEATNAFSERMGIAKIATAIKAAPVAQKVGMAVATVAVAGGTAAGIVAINQPAPAPTQPSTPAITQPKAEETKPEEKAEETKPEEKAEETKPTDDKPAATEQPAAPEKQEYEYDHQPAEDKPAESHEAAPAPAPVPTTPTLLGYKHILSAWNPDTNTVFRTSYGYDGEYGSREEAMQALIKMIQEGGKATPRGIEESEVPIYSGRD